VTHEHCHDVVCNGDRDHPVGAAGHGCSCVSRYERQLKEIERLQASLDSLYGAKFSDRVYHALKARTELAEAQVRELQKALLGVCSLTKTEPCWCSSGRDIKNYGHEEKCRAAACALLADY